MAVGDAVSIYLGTATQVYQPSTGVEVQISAIITQGTTDLFAMYNGTTTVNILDGDMSTSLAFDSANSPQMQMFNVAFMLTDSMYIRKNGTTDLDWIGGVETNA